MVAGAAEVPPLTAPLLSRLGPARGYAAALVLCLVVLGSVFDLGSEARQWPWAYRGDTMFYHLVVKSVTEGGWFLDVPLLGTPGALDLRDVPTSDNNLHVVMLRLLALVNPHYPWVLNTFFLLGFPLIFLTSLTVMRHFRVDWPPAVVASLLYAFAPFHLTRGEHHLFLSAYWQVPLASLLVLWVSRVQWRRGSCAMPPWRSRTLQLGVVICLILSSTGFYYAFFTCFFLLVAATATAVRLRTWRALLPGLAFVALISAGLAANLWPSLTHFATSGPALSTQRVPGDADAYALRLAQLLMPVSGHRLFALDKWKTSYNRRPLINENDHAALGVAGSVGFLGLIGWFFFRKPSAEGLDDDGHRGLLHHLSIACMAGVLLGTMGGFGSLVAFGGLPQVRAYNRISIFLSFFSLFALALWVDDFWRRQTTSTRRRAGAYVLLSIGTVFALGDQISPRALPDRLTEATFASDDAFVHQIESAVPRGARILQLPFVTFWESLPVARMTDYDLLRPYLHSNHLRWSYGTMKGREPDAWLRQTIEQPIDRFLETIAWSGFDGVYIDRFGFGDNAVSIESQLAGRLHETPLRSLDDRFLFFSLTRYRASVEARTPTVEQAARRQAALHPLLAVWREGFYDQEGTDADIWRWARSNARLELVNHTGLSRHVAVDMSLVGSEGTTVSIDSDLLQVPVTVTTGPKGQSVHLDVVLPPGTHPIRFTSPAEQMYPPNDFRTLVFSAHNFRMTAADAPADTGGVGPAP